MTRILFFAISPVIAVMAWNPAWAVDIHNADNRDYEVTIATGDEESSFTVMLGAGDEEEGVCEACTISIEGVGSIEAKGSEIIEVVGGKLTKKSP